MDVRHASPDQAKAFAASLSDQYLDCRRYGHRWNEQSEVREVKGVFYVKEHCACQSWRAYSVNKRTGHFIDDYAIHYAAGYLSDVGRITGDARGMLIVEDLTRGAAETKRRRREEREGKLAAVS
jgi:hypothetical protein